MQKDSKRDDVLVVGGGVIGLACAHYLTRAGRGVRVIDRGRVGEGASHGNCGLVFTSDLVPLCVPGAVRKELAGMLRGTSPLYIKPRLDAGLISWLVKFAAAGRAGRLQASMRARESILGSSERLFEELLALQEEIAGTGCLAKSFRQGLIDFFALKEGRLVFLCWKQGEQGIHAWHTLEGGFRGRMPIASFLTEGFPAPDPEEET